MGLVREVVHAVRSARMKSILKMKSLPGFLKLAALLAVGMMASCAPQGWTEAQKASVTPVSLKSVRIAEGAYHEPDGTDSPGLKKKMPPGLVPLLIGAAIDAGVEQSQQSSFNKSYGSHSAGARRNIPSGLDQRLSEKLKAQMKRHAFFGSRLKDDAAASIQPAIVKYGYVRQSETDEGEILVAPVVAMEFIVTGSDGKQLLRQRVTSLGMNPKPLKAFAANPAVARAAFEKELDTVAGEMGAVLAGRTGVEIRF